MYKQTLERWQTLIREQEDFLSTTVKERLAADPKFDFMADTAYRDRSAEIAKLEPQLAALRAHEEQVRALDNSGGTRGGGVPIHRTGADPELAEYRSACKEIFGGKRGAFEHREPTDDDARELRDFCNYVLTHGREISPELQKKFRTNLITTGTTTGGYGVPTFFSSAVIRDLDAMESVRRAGATVIPVMGDTNFTSMAKVTASRIAEGSTMTQSDPTVGRVTVSPHLLQANTVWSWAIQNRFVTDLVSEIRRAFTEGIAEVEGGEFLTGAGTTVYAQGLTVGGTSALTAGSGTVLTAAEITSLWFALHPVYQANASWFLNGTTLAEISILEDTNGNRIVQPNLQQGIMQLFGRPIINEPLMPNTATGLKPIMVADVRQAYLIGEEKDMTMLMDPYSRASTNEVRMYMYKYVDGRVKQAAAAKYITMA